MDGFKKKDKRRHHGGLYQRGSNSPTMSPTTLQPEITLRINDYGKKYARLNEERLFVSHYAYFSPALRKALTTLSFCDASL